MRRFDDRDRAGAREHRRQPRQGASGCATAGRPHLLDAEQLYDLFLDPEEACNLIAEPRSAPVLDELRGRLEQWMRETADPLLDGPVPPPPGAEYNDPDARSAGEATTIAPYS